MKRLLLCLLPGMALLLASCNDMHDQPSVRAYETTQRTVPKGSVPTTGRVTLTRPGPLPAMPAASREDEGRGAELYRINCSFCHGGKAGEPGPVGQHLQPPPPHLEKSLLRSLRNEDIFGFVTFGLGRMPPFENRLNNEERWILVRYLRTLP